MKNWQQNFYIKFLFKQLFEVFWSLLYFYFQSNAV